MYGHFNVAVAKLIFKNANGPNLALPLKMFVLDLYKLKSPLGFKRIPTVTIMYLLYSVNVYIFNAVIEIKFYSIPIDRKNLLNIST